MQLQAGYILTFVSDYLKNRKDANPDALLKSLCFFEVESTLPEGTPADKPEIAVLRPNRKFCPCTLERRPY